jgi:hypothetical protein
VGAGANSLAVLPSVVSPLNVGPGTQAERIRGAIAPLCTGVGGSKSKSLWGLLKTAPFPECQWRAGLGFACV